jgi:hypothetical protein
MFGSAMDLGMLVTVTHDHKAASKPSISMSTPQAPTIPPDACNLSAVVAGWIRLCSQVRPQRPRSPQLPSCLLRQTALQM